jgi:hypothetical protein
MPRELITELRIQCLLRRDAPDTYLSIQLSNVSKLKVRYITKRQCSCYCHQSTIHTASNLESLILMPPQFFLRRSHLHLSLK